MYNTQFFYTLENDFLGKVCGYYTAVKSRGLSNLLSYWSEYNMDGHILHRPVYHYEFRVVSAIFEP